VPYGYQPYTTIKDFDNDSLQKRIRSMEDRGYELIAQRKSTNGYEVVHYAKLKAGNK